MSTAAERAAERRRAATDAGVDPTPLLDAASTPRGQSEAPPAPKRRGAKEGFSRKSVDLPLAADERLDRVATAYGYDKGKLLADLFQAVPDGMIGTLLGIEAKYPALLST